MIISRLCHLTWIEAAIAELRPAQRVGSGVELAVRFLCRFTRSIKMKLAAPFPSAGRRSASRARLPHWCGRAPGSVLPRKLVKLSFALTTLCCSRFAPSLCLFLASRTSCLLLGCCFGGFGFFCFFFFCRPRLQNESAYKVFMNSCYEAAASCCGMTHCWVCCVLCCAVLCCVLALASQPCAVFFLVRFD